MLLISLYQLILGLFVVWLIFIANLRIRFNILLMQSKVIIVEGCLVERVIRALHIRVSGLKLLEMGGCAIIFKRIMGRRKPHTANV
jgi:hypothetical protein